ncbi:MAG TPA: nucleotidyltransferase [Candidatus Coprocola pullicola]|nr:nucleotidyltransferase [Candidatus Coprocola pullicola]
MKILGIVAEYNPFHKGHAYQIQKAKELTKADAVIVVMSGNFVQRGEPALLDKWTRSHMALLNGADIVVELPVLYATASAEYFAHSAVKLFDDMGIVTDICFGSEIGSIEPLERIASLLLQEPPCFCSALKTELEKGVSYASARCTALAKIFPESQNILSHPNNILAIEYIKALKKLNSTILPHTICRKGADYHSTDISSSTMASASAIRNALLEKNKNYIHHIPKNCHSLFLDALEKGIAPIFLKDFTQAFHYSIRTKSADEIANIFEVTEGLENRIFKALNKYYEITDILSFVKTKRYSYTKIQRILLHILLNIQKDDVLFFNHTGYIPYIRILGFRKESQSILGLCKKYASIPILTNLKNADTILDARAKRMLNFDTKATDIYYMAMPNKTYSHIYQDFTTSMVMICFQEA